MALVDCSARRGIGFWYQKLRNIGGDVGGAVKEFKKAVKDNEVEDATDEVGTTIEGEVTKKTKQ